MNKPRTSRRLSVIDDSLFPKQLFLGNNDPSAAFSSNNLNSVHNTGDDSPGKYLKKSLAEEQLTANLIYLNENINPVMSKMMVKIINENPRNIVQFMIDYIKTEQQYQERSLTDNIMKRIVQHTSPELQRFKK